MEDVTNVGTIILQAISKCKENGGKAQYIRINQNGDILIFDKAAIGNALTDTQELIEWLERQRVLYDPQYVNLNKHDEVWISAQNSLLNKIIKHFKGE